MVDASWMQEAFLAEALQLAKLVLAPVAIDETMIAGDRDRSKDVTRGH